MSFDLNRSDDQNQIVDAAHALLDAHFPVSRLREHRRDPLGAIAEFGGFALALPEDIGGSGFSIIEEVLMHVLFGRYLVSTSALAAPIGARLAAEIGETDLAQRLASGEVYACAAIKDENALVLFEPEAASYAVVWGNQRLQLVDLSALSLSPSKAMGHGRPLLKANSKAEAILGESAGTSLGRLADLLVSAQLLGIAEAARDLSVDYAGIREQFGRPIGSFQAIKHQCADMAIGAEMVSALLDMATIAEHDAREDAAFQIAALRRLAPRTALANAKRAIQIHGGMGFSAETDAHHYLKQAHILALLGGNNDFMSLPAPLAPIERH